MDYAGTLSNSRQMCFSSGPFRGICHLVWPMREIPEPGIGMARLLIQKLRWVTASAEAMAQYDAAG